MRIRPPWPPWFTDRIPQPDAHVGPIDHAAPDHSAPDLDPDLDVPGTAPAAASSPARPLAVAGVGVALLALAAGGVRATLSAIAENDTPVTFSSGTLLLTLEDDGSGLSVPLSDLAPGDTVDRFVDLTNTGTLDAGDLTVELTATGDAVLVDDGVDPVTTRALTLAVDSCSSAWEPSTSTCGGDSTALLGATTIGTLDGAPADLGLSFAPGGEAYLRLRFVLPDQDETSENGVLPSPTVQDASVDVTVTFRVEQRDATSTSG